MDGERKIRILLAKIGCDIHERGALTLLHALRDAGMEVIYTGRYQTPEGVAHAAVAEDVDIIALSDHTGSLPIIGDALRKALEGMEAGDIRIIAGGLISPEDAGLLAEMGISGNYGPGTPLEVIVDHIRHVVRGSKKEAD